MGRQTNDGKICVRVSVCQQNGSKQNLLGADRISLVELKRRRSHNDPVFTYEADQMNKRDVIAM